MTIVHLTLSIGLVIIKYCLHYFCNFYIIMQTFCINDFCLYFIYFFLLRSSNLHHSKSKFEFVELKNIFSSYLN